MNLLGFNFYGESVSDTPTPQVTGLSSVRLSGAVFDYLHVEKSGNVNTDIQDTRHWGPNTVMIAEFNNSLHSGNIENNGIPFSKFAVKCRRAGSTEQITVANVNYTGNGDYICIDHTQSSGYIIYSIVPISKTGIEGVPISTQIDCRFAGWWIADKDNSNNIIMFDKILNSIDQNVDIQLNQGRTVIETLSKFPQVYYTEKEYHTFTLTSTFASAACSYEEYKRIVDILTSHKPFIVKSGSGDVYVCDVSAPKKTSLLNAYNGRDYITITVECTEIDDYKEFMRR